LGSFVCWFVLVLFSDSLSLGSDISTVMQAGTGIGICSTWRSLSFLDVWMHVFHRICYVWVYFFEHSSLFFRLFGLPRVHCCASWCCCTVSVILHTRPPPPPPFWL
jgi:hypothetical protein